MFDLAAIRDTAVYREAFTEGETEGEKRGKLRVAPLLLEMGASEEEIAAKLELDIAEVRAAARAHSKKPTSRKPRSRRPRQPEK
ncbi:MAG TPA: hypothetical protein VFJ58_20575 [Armatimonadota bacterium]|nr:hypothetical protein [Armatimonadota bacterium]